MIEGPDQIIACPHCSHLAKESTLLSGNTFGAVTWSDGYQDAPMWFNPTLITKCRSCDEFFWLADAKKLGEIDNSKHDGQQYPEEWLEAEHAVWLNREDLLKAIEQKIWNTKDQQYVLRLKAWWATNGPIREGRTRNLTQEDKTNMNKLTDLLDISQPDQRIMVAEIYRELGGFDSSLRMLDYPFEDQYINAINQIKDFCKNRISDVRKIVSDEQKEPEIPFAIEYYKELLWQAGFNLDAGSIVEALAGYTLAIDISPDCPEGYEFRSKFRTDIIGDYKGALDDYNKAIALDSTVGLNYLNRGNIKEILGDLTGALEDYNMAIKNSGDNYYMFARAQLKDKLGDIEGAVDDCTDALQQYPNYIFIADYLKYLKEKIDPLLYQQHKNEKEIQEILQLIFGTIIAYNHEYYELNSEILYDANILYRFNISPNTEEDIFPNQFGEFVIHSSLLKNHGGYVSICHDKEKYLLISGDFRNYLKKSYYRRRKYKMDSEQLGLFQFEHSMKVFAAIEFKNKWQINKYLDQNILESSIDKTRLNEKLCSEEASFEKSMLENLISDKVGFLYNQLVKMGYQVYEDHESKDEDIKPTFIRYYGNNGIIMVYSDGKGDYFLYPE